MKTTHKNLIFFFNLKERVNNIEVYNLQCITEYVYEQIFLSQLYILSLISPAAQPLKENTLASRLYILLSLHNEGWMGTVNHVHSHAHIQIAEHTTNRISPAHCNATQKYFCFFRGFIYDAY